MGFSVFSEVAPSLLIFNTDIFPVTFGWRKEKANAKGNGDWHLRESRFCKNSNVSHLRCSTRFFASQRTSSKFVMGEFCKIPI